MRRTLPRRWARADAAVVRWAGPGTDEDRQLKQLLGAIAATHAHVRAAILIDRLRGGAGQLRALARSRSTSHGYLLIASRPVASWRCESTCSARAGRHGACEPRRGDVARGGRIRRLRALPYGRRRVVPRRARHAHGARPRLVPDPPGLLGEQRAHAASARSIAAWRRAIGQMVASRAPLQIIDSLNDWSMAARSKPSRAWASASRLRPLPRRAPRGAPARPAARTRPAATRSHHPRFRLRHRRSTPPPLRASRRIRRPSRPGFGGLVAGHVVGRVRPHDGVRAGDDARRASPPAARSARCPPSLSSLSAALPYHAHVVVASAVGRVGEPGHRVHDARRRAGDAHRRGRRHRLRSQRGRLQRRPRNRDGVPATAISNAILAGNYNAVLPLGDEQYNAGTAAGFAASYDPTWGRLKAIAHPAVGNHEYGSPGAAPYFDVLRRGRRPAPAKGWYSYDLGSWHLIALNSNCALLPGGCGAGSPQEPWLRADLAAHPVALHARLLAPPAVHLGRGGPTAEMSTIWDDLMAAGADVVSMATSTTTNASQPRTPTARATTPTASASSSSAPAARTTSPSAQSTPPTARCVTTPASASSSSPSATAPTPGASCPHPRPASATAATQPATDTARAAEPLV